MTGTPSLHECVAALEEEQVALWCDLADARRRSMTPYPVVPGTWSIDCDGIAARIVTIARLVGPTLWERVSVHELLEGVYEKVHADAGIGYPVIDWDEVRGIYAWSHRFNGKTWDGPPVTLIGADVG